MKRVQVIIAVIFLVVSLPCQSQRPFTAGNIVVYRVGDGSTPLTFSTAPVFLDEFTPNGTLVQSIPMPTSPNGANARLTATGTEPDGMMTLSADGKYLVVPGSTTAVNNDPYETDVVIGLVDFTGKINTSTIITDYEEAFNFVGNFLYTAASDNGNRLWFGTHAALRYTTAGSTTSTSIASTDQFIYGTTIADGQLYTSVTEQNPLLRKVGTGLPTTGNQLLPPLPGLTSASPQIPFQFAFADLDAAVPGADVLYVADYGTGAGGIKKYSLVNGNWVANGTAGTNAERYLGLTISVAGSTVTIFATRQGSNTLPVKGGELVKLIDNSGYNAALTGTPTGIAQVAVPDAMSYRGVALVPQPAPYTPGNIVVYRVGDGSTPLTFSTAPVFLDEFTPSGTLVQSIPMPTSPNGANARLTATGTEPDGMMTLSADGKYLVVPGSTTAVNNDPYETDVVIGLVDFTGKINTSTVITDYEEAFNFVGNFLYTAASDNGNRLWFGTHAALRYTTAGSTTSTSIASTDQFIYGTTIADGQLYTSVTEQNPLLRKVGTGLPTTGNQLLPPLPGLTSASPQIPFQFAFADLDAAVPGADVLYVADYGTGAGGIKKYSLVNGNWVANGTAGTNAERYLGLTISVAGNTVTIFATRQGSNTLPVKGGELVKLIDNSGYNAALTGTPTRIAQVAVPDAMSYRGVALVPQACTIRGLTVTNITSAQATLSWTASGANYEWAVTESSVPPASGQPISMEQVTKTNLANGTNYFAHVRAVCNALSKSEWISVPFTTTCQAPNLSLITISFEANGHGIAKWPAVFGATGYEYLISNSGTLPANPAFQATTDTVINLANVSAASRGFFHIRTNCGNGYSEWLHIPFSTGCFIPEFTISVDVNSALVKWNKIQNVVRYEYALTRTAGKPLSGTYTVDTFYNIHKLIPGSQNYFHVRTICPDGSLSEWKTISFDIPGLLVYPNPARETLHIRLNGTVGIGTSVSIFDINGKLMERVTLNGGIANVDTRVWATGIYLLQYNDGKNRYVSKIIIQ